MSTVNVAEERRADVVTEQLLQAWRQIARDVPRNGEAVVLLGAQPARGVLQDHAQARLPPPVGAAAVPEAAQVEHGRPGRHGRGLNRILRGRPAARRPAVAAGGEPGGAVGSGYTESSRCSTWAVSPGPMRMPTGALSW